VIEIMLEDLKESSRIDWSFLGAYEAKWNSVFTITAQKK